MTRFNVNSREVYVQAARLREIHRSALPAAIRQTITRAAFNVKSETMPKSARETFVQRSPNFFKANSKVKPARGLNLQTMKAEVGFVSKGGTDTSVDDLRQQEVGGSIKGRALIPLKNARAGKSWNKKVKSSMRVANLKGHITDPRRAGSRSNGTAAQGFVKSAVHAGKGGFIRGTGSQKNIVFQIRSLKRVNGNTKVKSIPVYSIERKRRVRPKATFFMKKASLESAKKMHGYFIQEGNKQLTRQR